MGHLLTRADYLEVVPLDKELWYLALLSDSTRVLIEPLIDQARNPNEEICAYLLAVRLDSHVAEDVKPANEQESWILGAYGFLAGSWLIRALELTAGDPDKRSVAIGIAGMLDTRIWDLA